MSTDIRTINDSGMLRVTRRRSRVELLGVNSTFKAQPTPAELAELREPRVVRGVRGVSTLEVLRGDRRVLTIQRFREYGAWGDVLRIFWPHDYLMIVYTADLARAAGVQL